MRDDRHDPTTNPEQWTPACEQNIQNVAGLNLLNPPLTWEGDITALYNGSIQSRKKHIRKTQTGRYRVFRHHSQRECMFLFCELLDDLFAYIPHIYIL